MEAGGVATTVGVEAGGLACWPALPVPGVAEAEDAAPPIGYGVAVGVGGGTGTKRGVVAVVLYQLMPKKALQIITTAIIPRVTSVLVLTGLSVGMVGSGRGAGGGAAERGRLPIVAGRWTCCWGIVGASAAATC
ncbi:hypothetical protein EPA93_25005 [Ktedonosporobacter rubrisoli]|uniref:Uncharacterized protein n=1 Tax=Ktedonosporobacter rubrisoli TaxID=2509675 RepID=A0A4P6JTZ0_KTERU|nr:hypothetical protein EPA93_25005 [Ktedonosporobacter rubrisoli]